MKRKVVKIFAVFFAVTTVLVLTNPNPKRFHEYLGHTTSHGLRAHYWVVCTVYEAPNSDGYSKNDRYLGIFLNFFKISN